MSKLYIIGSLRNPCIPDIANTLRSYVPEVEVFDDWYAAGPEADDKWKTYEKEHRGHTLKQALEGPAARNVYNFDKKHLMSADGALLVLPAGRSGHLELGFMAGLGKWTGILMDEADPERWDVMYQFADGVFDKASEAAGSFLKFVPPSKGWRGVGYTGPASYGPSNHDPLDSLCHR